MKKYDSPEAVLQYAYRLLSYRGRSEEELKRKFRGKNIDEGFADTVISRLKACGFIDDRKLACSLLKYAEENRYMSIAGIRKFLRERGIPRLIIEETASSVDDTESAMKLAEKKLRHMSGYPPDRIVKKLYGILSRKGYSYGVIKTALKHFGLEEDI